jgi:hypothetical protein
MPPFVGYPALSNDSQGFNLITQALPPIIAKPTLGFVDNI